MGGIVECIISSEKQPSNSEDGFVLAYMTVVWL